jgi:hypothetical protein
VVLASSETREKGRGTARSTATSTLAVDDLLDDLKLPGGFFFSARRQQAPAGEREVERGQMRGRGEFQRGGSAFNCRSEPGLWCTTPETIGRRWRCSGAALCAKCRGLLGFVGGCVARSKHKRVQLGYGRIQARSGRYGAPRFKVGVPTCCM